MLPLVGISTSELRIPPHVEPLAESDPARRELALGLDYPRAMDGAGAIPLVIPPMAVSDVDELVERLDGLLLSGGPDIHPSFYDAEPDRSLGPTEPDLDAFELELVRRADARGLPILAICRGLQVLNVVRGGTLVQHLPDVVGDEVQHRQTAPGRVATHGVRIEEGARLAEILGADQAQVNSFHHQAIEALGRDLRAVAWSPDGVIEAIEATDRPFCMAVQWHAESLAGHDDHRRLFEAFVDAASERAASAGAAA
ncbi:MAG TPA: gamma-glutamyl-gamma-aminobutyrate hydrolase family protein [Capillimicrobium sp.]|nr:gamma-glutamyl-gamma-aminobutyrate hydrolase family protein [Capillimicrobium sp.]